METPTRWLHGAARLTRSIRALGRNPQLRLLLLTLVVALSLGAVKQTAGPGDELLPRIASWPGYTRGVAWDVAIAGNYAYVAIGDGGLIVLDVTDPAQPTRVGGYLPPGQTRQVRVVGSRAYLATSVHRGGGCEMEGWRGHLLVLDVSDPTRPTLLGSHVTGSAIQSVFVDGNRVYLGNDGGDGHSASTFWILDVSNPSRPATLSVDQTARGANAIAVAAGRAYVASPEELRVLDVSQPASPTVLATVETNATMQAMQAVDDRLYVVGSTREHSGLLIYDTGDALAPQLLGTLDLANAPLDIQVVGDYAYAATADAGLVVIDVSNPAAPVPVATWDTPGVALRVAVTDGIGFVADYYGGLQVVDVRDPGQMLAVACFDTGMTARMIRRAGEKAYLLSSDTHSSSSARSRVEVVDVTDPTEPALLGTYDSPRAVASLDVADDRAYLAWTHAGVAGFEIVDLHEPLQPVSLSDTTITPPGATAWGIGVRVRASGHYAYVTTTDHEGPDSRGQWQSYPRLRIFDVADPAKPVLCSQVVTGNLDVGSFEVMGDRGYLNSYSTFEMVNVADPKAPAQLLSVGLPDSAGEPGGVDVFGDYAYLSRGWKGFVVVDLRRSAPFTTDYYDTLGQVHDVSVEGHYVYAAEGWEGVEAFDVTDPVQPLPIGRSHTRGTALGIEVAGDYACVAESGGGLGIFRLAPEVVTIVKPPDSVTLAAGDAATLTVGAFGRGPLSYQWYVGESGDQSQPITGTDAPAFTTPALTEAASYWVRVSSATGVSDSQTARVHLVPAVSVELLGLWPGGQPRPEWEGFAVDVAVSGQHAFLADGEGGLRILDVSDPAHPRSAAVYSSNTRGVAVGGQFVYLVADTLQVLDASDPTHPSQIANLEAGTGNARDIFPVGEFAYFLSDGLKVLDRRNPAQPQIVASDALSDDWDQLATVGMSFVGRYAALGQNWGGLQVLDLSVPAEPRWVGAYYSDAAVLDVAWQGNVACVTLGPELAGLDVVDMTDVRRPVRMARVSLPLAHHVALMGSYACVTGEGLQAFDLSDPRQPVRVGSHQLGSEFDSETHGLQVVGDLVYVAAGQHGLAIYQLKPQLRLNPPVIDGDELRLSWLSAPGIRLQRATNLSAPDWQDVSGSEGVGSLLLSLTDRNGFFRLARP